MVGADPEEWHGSWEGAVDYDICKQWKDDERVGVSRRYMADRKSTLHREMENFRERMIRTNMNQ